MVPEPCVPLRRTPAEAQCGLQKHELQGPRVNVGDGRVSHGEEEPGEAFAEDQCFVDEDAGLRQQRDKALDKESAVKDVVHRVVQHDDSMPKAVQHVVHEVAHSSETPVLGVDVVLGFGGVAAIIPAVFYKLGTTLLIGEGYHVVVTLHVAGKVEADSRQVVEEEPGVHCTGIREQQHEEVQGVVGTPGLHVVRRVCGVLAAVLRGYRVDATLERGGELGEMHGGEAVFQRDGQPYFEGVAAVVPVHQRQIGVVAPVGDLHAGDVDHVVVVARLVVGAAVGNPNVLVVPQMHDGGSPNVLGVPRGGGASVLTLLLPLLVHVGGVVAVGHELSQGGLGRHKVEEGVTVLVLGDQRNSLQGAVEGVEYLDRVPVGEKGWTLNPESVEAGAGCSILPCEPRW